MMDAVHPEGTVGYGLLYAKRGGTGDNGVCLGVDDLYLNMANAEWGGDPWILATVDGLAPIQFGAGVDFGLWPIGLHPMT